MEGERRYKPSAIKRTKGKLRRIATAGLIVAGSALAGAGIEATTGVVSKTVGNITQTGKDLLHKGANAVIEWDNKDFNASSAGISAEKAAEGMQKAGIPVPSKKP